MIPKAVYADWDAKAKGQAAEAEWNGRFAAYRKAFPALARELKRRMAGELPKQFAQTAVDATITAQVGRGLLRRCQYRLPGLPPPLRRWMTAR